jgi:hypothetical protein
MIDIGLKLPLVLRKGHSDNPAEGACAMDALNWIMHGKHGDAPECASPAIAKFVIIGNDGMPDEVRQKLIAFLPRIAGSRSREHEIVRAETLALGAVRVIAANAMERAGLNDEAAKLRAVPDSLAEAGRSAQWAEAAAAEAAEAGRSAQWAAGRSAQWAAEAVALSAVAAVAVAAEAEAAEAAARGAEAEAEAWDDYFVVLDLALKAGPEGEPWSANQINLGVEKFAAAGGVLVNV